MVEFSIVSNDSPGTVFRRSEETLNGIIFSDGIGCPSDPNYQCGESCPNFDLITKMLEDVEVTEDLQPHPCELTGEIPEILKL